MHGYEQLFEGLRHFQRYDEQRDRKGENAITKGFDAFDLMAAVVKCFFPWWAFRCE